MLKTVRAQIPLPVNQGGTGATNPPAFSAVMTGVVTPTGGVYTKVTCNSEEFDTNSNYDNATNYRFTPTVAGYYQVNGVINFVSTGSITRAIVAIYKNGSAFKFGNDVSASVNKLTASALVYMNGTTDYVELFGWVNGVGTFQFDPGTYFQASMTRGA